MSGSAGGGRPLLIADGHLDLAANALLHRRDLTQPVQVLREREGGSAAQRSAHPDSLERREGPLEPHPGTPTVSLPELRAGRVGIVLASIMSRVQAAGAVPYHAARTREAAYAGGQSHLAYYRALERLGEVRIILSSADLRGSAAEWEKPSAGPEARTPVGVILSMESADPILGPDQVEEWWRAGLRSVSLTHFGAGVYGHGTGTRGGLYPAALPLLRALRRAGVVIDLTHSADLAFWEILEHWDGPVHASHCVCRALVPGQRHLSDEMIRAIAERGGVIGVVFAEQMLDPRWDWDNPSTHHATATRAMSAAVDHVDHICQLTGSSRHVAIGSDLDGGFGRELAPIDLNTVADLSKFPEILRRRGYAGEQVRGIAHGNLLRLFLEAWGG